MKREGENGRTQGSAQRKYLSSESLWREEAAISSLERPSAAAAASIGLSLHANAGDEMDDKYFAVPSTCCTGGTLVLSQNYAKQKFPKEDQFR